MTRRPRPALPLWGWAASTALAVGLALIGSFTAALAIAGQLTAQAVVLCFCLGAVAVVVVTVAVAIAAQRTAGALRLLRDDALTRLRDPGAPGAPVPERGVRTTAELSELSSALDALALRMRVADELAHHHRQSAETASAGMFELLSGLVEAEEGIRGQLAAELHDTVAQSLAVARTLLADGQSERALEFVEDAEDQVRSTMARARPPALREGDLADAVGGLRDDLHRRYGLTVEVSWPSEPRALPLVTAVTVYRFFQEALLNVVKHADVDRACARLETSDAGDGPVGPVVTVVATVEDAGSGFDPTQVRPDRGRHVGLGLLRERVRLAGGSLDVAASAGRGSRLTMRLPVTTAAVGPVTGAMPMRLRQPTTLQRVRPQPISQPPITPQPLFGR